MNGSSWLTNAIKSLVPQLRQYRSDGIGELMQVQAGIAGRSAQRPRNGAAAAKMHVPRKEFRLKI